MSAVKLHNFIERYNVLENPTRKINNYLRSHRTVYKVALVVNHLFRAVGMTAFFVALPFSSFVSAGICFVSSLFYRLTVETNCAYKFALPSYVGSIAILSGKATLPNLINRTAFSSLRGLAMTAASLRLLAAYVTYVILTVDYDVNKKLV